jgi:aspartyl-tRNA(Asn)/glutamyl-tRNA(Gln) amidotransferase subunit A
MGTFALSSGYHDRFHARATKARGWIARDYDQAFVTADLLLSPVAPTPPFPRGARDDDPLAMYLTDAMTIPANLAGIPALSVPCGVDRDGMPVGLQLQAPAFREDRLFRAAAAFERAMAADPPGAGRMA